MNAGVPDRVRLVQLIAAAAPHDAVTTQALALQEELERSGVASSVAAEHVDPAMDSLVGRIEDIPAGTPLLLRYSIWSAVAEHALRSTAPLGFIYHNITPAHLLAGGNPHVADLCARGRRMLPRFAERCSAVVADSTFNAQELNDAGIRGAKVVPLLLDLPEPPATRPPTDHRVLYVGRVAPSKRLEDSIDALRVLRDLHLPDAELHIVGSPDAFPAYARALQRHASSYGLEEAVVFHGSVDDVARNTAYLSAGAYLSLSEHEGFCVPILEAAAHGLPVVARDAGAVRETAGGSALLVPGRDAHLAAAALNAALTDSDVRSGLARNARVRLPQVDRRAVAPALIQALEPVLA